ncbi:potassium transporter [Actinobacillus delphinicola]|nr:TrkH family potassium uptake protein [Actinobacillus delphinicola]MDG6897513.1 potassium transporter [Actinobacillus delphinicola]
MQILSVLRIVGILIMGFSGVMLIPASVALIYGDGGGKTFMESFAIFLALGVTLWWLCHNHKEQLRARDGFLIVVAFWVVMGLLGAVPFLLSEHLHISVNSAIFESFSGFTTTGATVLTNLDSLPHAILFYRQLTNWFGGMGVIVLMVAVLPLLGVGGNQIYHAESSGVEMKNDKLRPRISEVAKLLWLCYFFFTALCAISYWLAGMNWFDAISHSFATLSNGGFSTHNASLPYFNSSAIYVISAIFMLVGGCNFNLHIIALSHFPHKTTLTTYWKDPEFRFFVFLQAAFIIIFSLGLYIHFNNISLTQAFVKGSAQVTTMSMNCGYSVYNIDDLPPFLSMLLVFACLLGGCAGSTSGGLKMIRALVLWLQGKRELLMLIHPNIIHPVKLGDNVVPRRALENIWAFLIVYILVFWLCVFGAIACGMGGFDAIGAVISTITNTGPGLGSTSENFSSVPDASKLVFSFAMVAGRLEFFSLLVVFMPAFWKK